MTDEIWFFFDVEEKDTDKWDKRFKIIKRLSGLRKKPNIRIRLLMTTGCIEYWLMLHYRQFAPPIHTEADKKRILDEVIKKEPGYFKGDPITTSRIAANYPAAAENADKVLRSLIPDGLPGLEDTDERNHWLCVCSKTFSTVHEAIEYLENLKA